MHANINTWTDLPAVKILLHDPLFNFLSADPEFWPYQLPRHVFVFTGAWKYEISRGVPISASHNLLIRQLSLIQWRWLAFETMLNSGAWGTVNLLLVKDKKFQRGNEFSNSKSKSRKENQLYAILGHILNFLDAERCKFNRPASDFCSRTFLYGFTEFLTPLNLTWFLLICFLTNDELTTSFSSRFE